MQKKPWISFPELVFMPLGMENLEDFLNLRHRLHHSFMSRCVGSKSSTWPTSAGLTFYCLLNGLCMTLVTLSALKPDLGLSLFFLTHHCSCQSKQGSWLSAPMVFLASSLTPFAGLWREAFLKWGHEPREKLWSWKRYLHFRAPSLPPLALWTALR